MRHAKGGRRQPVWAVATAAAMLVAFAGCDRIVGVGDYSVAPGDDASLADGGDASRIHVQEDAGGDAAGDSSEADDGAAEQQAAAAYARAWCQKSMQCIGTTTFIDETTCEQRVTLRFANEMGASGDGLTPSLVLACANEFANASCKGYWDGDVCPEVTGTLQAGSGCGVGSQCASGACEFDGPCGTCETPAGVGGGCKDDSDCAYLLYCGRLNLCTGLAQDGEACGASSNAVTCDWGLACRNGTCVPSGIGMPCTPSLQDCPTYQFCAADDTCHRFTYALPGSLCGWIHDDYSEWQDCYEGYCQPGAQSWTGTCPAVAVDGQPCHPPTTICSYPSACYYGTCKFDDVQTCN